MDPRHLLANAKKNLWNIQDEYTQDVVSNLIEALEQLLPNESANNFNRIDDPDSTPTSFATPPPPNPSQRP